MFVRFLDGPRKGEVCDVLPNTAIHLFRTGMAEDVRNTVQAQEVAVVDAPPAPPPPATKAKAKARKKRKRVNGKR